MKAPAFWGQPPGLLARLLQPFGWLYGRITAARMARSGAACGQPVICVGNLTVGGAGKTPTVRWLAAWAKERGLAPVILSRGYGGQIAGPTMVDPALHDATACGDEPLLLARDAPVVVAHDRVAGAAMAVGQGAKLIIMDDGLQNPSLTKNLRIAVVDCGFGIGNGCCLPAGPLRAPLDLQWPHVDAVLLVGEGAAGETVAHLAVAAGKPLVRMRLVPDATAIGALRGKPLLAFAGIGRPEKFFATLREAGLDVRVTRAFSDHHAYGPADVTGLSVIARDEGLTLVTTEKDAVRYPAEVAVLPVSLEPLPGEEQRLAALISARIPSRP
jgi:tetraacyldisaccharide 4'-kinase